MRGQILNAVTVLREFYEDNNDPILGRAVDRPQIVAHALLSALAHHWPTRMQSEWVELLAATMMIKDQERTRWAVQRRIAIAKLAAAFESTSSQTVF